MITTKTLTRTALVLLAGTLVPATLSAMIDISTPSSFYDDANWYAYRGSANVSFNTAVDANSIDISKLDDGYSWAYFTPIALEAGEHITFSATITFSDISTSNKFYIGLFDGGSLCSQENQIAHSYQSKTDVSGMPNSSNASTVPGVATGDMHGIFASSSTAYLRSESKDHSFMSTSSGVYQASSKFATEFASFSATTPYAIEMTLAKGEDSLTLSFAIGNETAQTLNFTSDISRFNVIGFRSPTAAGGTATLSNMSITTTGTVIPEPSAFGLLAGAFALALAGTRRRRRR